MAEQSQQEKKPNDAAQLAKGAASAARTGAAVAKAAGKAAAGDWAGAAVDLIKDENVRKLLLLLLLGGSLIFLCVSMFIGASITGAAENIANNWEEAWEENRIEQGIISSGNALYFHTTGQENASNAALYEALFAALDKPHTIDGYDAENSSLVTDESETVTVSDYELTLQALLDEEALMGENGALRRRLDLIKARVRQRGEQLKTWAVSQYALDALGSVIATDLIETFQNPILYQGIDWENSHVTVDTDSFELTDLQALKILAAFSVQQDCNLTETDLWDLMDYCGWYDLRLTELDGASSGNSIHTADRTIYDGQTKATFEQEIGGVVNSGDDASTVIELEPPYVPLWSGTCAPQWYYEELAQIRSHNKAYFRALEKGTLKEGDIPWGVTGPEDEIDLSAFSRLSACDTFGLVDRIYTAATATLTINRTEYEQVDADSWTDIRDSIGSYTASIENQWLNLTGPASYTDYYGNTVKRYADGTHSYIFQYEQNYAALRGDPYGTVKYLLYDGYNNLVDSFTSHSPGGYIEFSGLYPDSYYAIILRTTELDGSDQHDTFVLSFYTQPDSDSAQGYKLQLDLEISFTSQTVDQICNDILGLWPDGLRKTELASNGLEYAEGHAGDENFLKSWTDTYTAPDGTSHTLTFQRQSGYQQKANRDTIVALAALMDISTAGLFEPDYGYGDDIVAVALKEHEYYTANDLNGGARYWGKVRDALGWSFGDNAAWCVAFVYTCANECGYLGDGGCFGNTWKFACEDAWWTILNEGSAVPHADPGEGYCPVPGDLIFFNDHAGVGNFAHIGIVQKVDEDGTLYVIEGNAGNKLKIHTYANYAIGTPVFDYMIAAYLHPNYPASYPETPAYQSVNGKVAARTTARYVTAANGQTLLLAGVGRFQESQLPAVVAMLQERYPQFYSEAMTEALDSGNMASFVSAWNTVSAEQGALEFKKIQQEVAAKLYIRPVTDKVAEDTGFDWTKTAMRQEILWSICTASDNQTAIISTMKALSAGLDNNISDTELYQILTGGRLTQALQSKQAALWPDHISSFRPSFLDAAETLLEIVEPGE